MAGLGETCSHVGALLFYTEKLVREYAELACTSKPVQWKPGSKRKLEKYGKLSELNFVAPHKKYFTKCTNEVKEPTTANKKKAKVVPQIDAAELSKIFVELQNSGNICPLMMLTGPSSNAGCPVAITKSNGLVEKLYLPKKLYNVNLLNLSLEDILKVDVHLDLTEDEIQKVEKITRKQRKSKNWILLRAGRITASVFKQSVRTDCKKPSISLIKKICYPEQNKAFSPAILHGIRYEHTAYVTYKNQMRLLHPDFKIRKSGLILNCEYPQFGASPDGITVCKCCGEGILEIKCPELLSKYSFRALQSKPGFCIKNGELDRNHEYYYQIQMQIFLSNSKYADFVVWSPHEPLYYERVYPDEGFWLSKSFQATAFFKTCIIPELLAHYYTKKNEVEKNNNSK